MSVGSVGFWRVVSPEKFDMNPTVLKVAQILAIVLVCLGLDQWTKHLAQTRLAASRSGHFDHNVVLTVAQDMDQKTVRDVVTAEFGEWNSAAEINDILSVVTTDGAVRMAPSRTVSAGDVIEVRHREIVIVPGYFDLQYTRNEGAAFSLLADTDSPLRKPFFVLVALIAVGVIAWILRGVTLQQQLLIWALSFICGGAIGNLIDRLRLDYVIDFIVWKWTDEYRWPTFNLADTFIVVGVILMALEMIAETIRERREKA